MTEQQTAQVIEYDTVGMAANQRCTRCEAQAYVEAVMASGSLMFCAHHASEHWPALLKQATMIADHRPFLATQERTPVPTA